MKIEKIMFGGNDKSCKYKAEIWKQNNVGSFDNDNINNPILMN